MTEQSIRGSQAAFSENLRVNTGLVRSMLRATDLVTELIPVGSRTRINCAVMYLESVANPKLVAEVKRRISKIDSDYLNDSGHLEQFIEDRFICRSRSLFPPSGPTEWRPIWPKAGWRSSSRDRLSPW
jgi:spore germination protein KA